MGRRLADEEAGWPVKLKEVISREKDKGEATLFYLRPSTLQRGATLSHDFFWTSMIPTLLQWHAPLPVLDKEVVRKHRK